MALVVYGIANLLLPALLPADTLLTTPPAVLLLAGGTGGLFYLGLCVLLRVEALDFFTSALRQRLRRRFAPPDEPPAS
jgi:hypothetical protein